MSPTEDETPSAEEPFEEHVSMETFSQILEMDGPDDDEFSRGIVCGFFDQAELTFEEMDSYVEEKDLDNLSSKGHFLKGSSATIGLFKVRDGCEKIQRYGKKEKLDGSPEDDEDLCLKTITETIKEVRSDVEKAKKALNTYYGGDLEGKQSGHDISK